MTIATVKPSALTSAAREVLSLASPDWRRMPMRNAHIVSELELMGLVETETRWQWSTRNSGAGKHVMWWRRCALIFNPWPQCHTPEACGEAKECARKCSDTKGVYYDEGEKA